MSWTQVYVTGLPQTVDPTDEEIESTLASTFNLADTNQAILWAGPGTTLVKREDSAGGKCRGFAFLVFYSNEGAQIAVDRINNGSSTGIVHDNGETATMEVTPTLQLRAELCKPKPRSKKGSGGGGDVSDIRLKRQRAAPVRKHPVITSSDGKRTNLGSKTK